MTAELSVNRLLSDKDAGIVIKKPDLQKDISVLETKLLQIRGILNAKLSEVPYYKVEVPEFFLTQPLTDGQRKIVDRELGEFYAKRSVSQQEIIATVPISESSEKMVFLPSLFQKHGLPFTLSDLPFNKACGEWAGKPRVFWVRESMSERLVELAEAFSQVGIFFHLEDAFRPVGVQEGLFKRRVSMIVDEHPDWDKEAVLLEAKSKTAVSPRLASHKGGAAIDLTLRRILDGQPLDLGNKYPEGGALVAIDCPFVTTEQWQTRQLFANGFQMAGFAIYPGEDWHASYQDNLSGVANGKVIEGYVTKYGPIKNFSQESGEILEVYEKSEYDRLFLD